MKHIKLYENFDWTEDDFDFEEEDENKPNFKFNDKIITTKPTIKIWHERDKKWFNTQLVYNRAKRVIRIKHSSKINVPDYDGYLINVNNISNDIWFKMEDFIYYYK